MGVKILWCNWVAPSFPPLLNRLIKFFSQGASDCVGKTRVCCCSYLGQQDKEVWGKFSKNQHSRCMQDLLWPLAKEGYSMDCEAAAGFQSPLQRTSSGGTGSFSWFGNQGVGCPGPCEGLCTVPSASLRPRGWALCLRFPLLGSSVPAVLRFLLLCITAMCQEIPAPGVKC